MIKGTINFPGDKSISHRVLILASISNGNSTIYNLSQSKDVQRTMSILKNCGFREMSKEYDYNQNVRCIISTKMSFFNLKR